MSGTTAGRRRHQETWLWLTPAGRERARRLRQAETEVLLAADRMQVARLLACIGAQQLRLAKLSRRHAIAEHPRLARSAERIVESLAQAIQDEIDRFARWHDLS